MRERRPGEIHETLDANLNRGLWCSLIGFSASSKMFEGENISPRVGTVRFAECLKNHFCFSRSFSRSIVESLLVVSTRKVELGTQKIEIHC